MLDSPPPSTMHVGIEQVDDLRQGRAPAGRRGGPAPPAASRIAGGGAGRQCAGVARVGTVAVARQCGAGRCRSPGSPIGRTSNAGRAVRRVAARAGGCGPTRRRRRAGRDARGRPPRCRRRQPVPRMTPNTRRWPAPAPSAASDRAKQLASFSTRTSRPSLAPMSRSNGWPLSAMELAFFTRPVAGLITPGMPMPTLAVTPSWASTSRTRAAMASSVAFVAAGRGWDAVAQRLRAVGREDDDLDLGAAEVDADAVLGHGRGSLGGGRGKGEGARWRRHFEHRLSSRPQGLPPCPGDDPESFGLLGLWRRVQGRQVAGKFRISHRLKILTFKCSVREQARLVSIQNEAKRADRRKPQ